jgi:hypothetical protein
MPIYKFKHNDVYINTIKSYPSVKYFIYGGDAFYNNTPTIPGTETAPATDRGPGGGTIPEDIRHTKGGSVNLFELNVNRAEGDFGYIASSSTGNPDPSSARRWDDTFENQPQVLASDPDGVDAVTSIKNTGLIYQFMVKDSTRIGFSSVSSTAFNAGAVGEVFTGSYPFTASITKEYYSATDYRQQASEISGDENNGLTIDSYGSVSHLYALKNTLNHYTYVSPFYTYDAVVAPPALSRSLDDVQVGLINVPTIFYGSQIKPGSVNLSFYVAGSLVGRLRDINRDGVLYQTEPSTAAGSGSDAGVVLYNEGFLVLTGSWDLTSGDHSENYGTTDNFPSWVNFAQPLVNVGPSATPRPALSSSFLLEMSGTNKTQAITMFATAPKGEMNQSSNPTFTTYYTGAIAPANNQAYIQNQNVGIKNIVKSDYNTPTGSFERTTYISKIGIYDKDMNLIALAKPATPIKKTAQRDFTFKIELDI